MTKTTSFESYNAKTTSISYPWPADVTGIERIALSAQGDLQRVLSAFFARPIVIALVYSQTLHQTSPASALVPLTLPNPTVIASASPETPIVQTRQVHLQCSGKIVCTATSRVRITSSECARLFLEEKYAIGQMFRRLEKVPAFELLSVGSGPVDEIERSSKPSRGGSGDKKDEELWRKYKLFIPDFECEIIEVFPSREMFMAGESWLLDGTTMPTKGTTGFQNGDIKLADRSLWLLQSGNWLFGVGFLLMIAFEAALFANGRSWSC